MEVRKNKLYVLYIFISLFIFTLCIGNVSANEYTNYYGITMTSQEYNNLVNLGFTENEIYYMLEETFELNKDISSNLVAESNKYYKTIYTDLNGSSYSVEITEDEYDNQSMADARGTVSTEYKNMISTMSKSDSTFRYKVTVGWNQMPSTKSYDIIGVGFETSDNVYISSPVYFSYSYCDSDANCTTSTVNYGKKKLSTGGSAVYKIPSEATNGLSVVLYYDVSKNTTDTITRLDMCGDYSHATSTVTSTQYSVHSINITGITLGSAVGYYDEIPCALSTWGGSW